MLTGEITYGIEQMQHVKIKYAIQMINETTGSILHLGSIVLSSIYVVIVNRHVRKSALLTWMGRATACFHYQ